MKLNDEFKLLVILGSWNRNIFSKKWIKKFLLPDDEFNFEFSLGPENSHRITTEELRIEFRNNRLNFLPIKKTIEIYEKIIGLAEKISDYLPHTPVTGYGINFIFNENSDKINKELIKTNDSEKLTKFGKIISSRHVHEIIVDKKTVNIAIVEDTNQLIFDFNFHFDIEDLTEFKENVYDTNIQSFHDLALEIMNNVYLIQNNEA